MHSNKRSLIPIIGEALGFLSGTLSESDLGSIRLNLKRIATSHSKPKHVVEESIPLMKTNQRQVIENRLINHTISLERNS